MVVTTAARPPRRSDGDNAGGRDGESRRAKDERLKSLGRKGENLAADYLERSGLVLLSRNWRCREGELDLVATDGARLVVVEVKTRSGTAFGSPVESITADKIYRIRRLANAWLTWYRVGPCEVRFDVITVLWPDGGKPRMQHLPGVF